jgi:hypothetical protein
MSAVAPSSFASRARRATVPRGRRDAALVAARSSTMRSRRSCACSRAPGDPRCRGLQVARTPESISCVPSGTTVVAVVGCSARASSRAASSVSSEAVASVTPSRSRMPAVRSLSATAFSSRMGSTGSVELGGCGMLGMRAARQGHESRDAHDAGARSPPARRRRAGSTTTSSSSSPTVSVSPASGITATRSRGRGDGLSGGEPGLVREERPVLVAGLRGVDLD